MKLADPRNPVMFGWLSEQGFRLDSAPYLSGAYEARKLLERLPGTQPLRELTTGYDGGIFNGPKFSRLYTNDPDYGVPFLGSTDMLEADFTNLPLLHKKIAERLPYLEVEPGMTMISCSGTIGRTAYVRSDMAGFWSSQHTMKVSPDAERVLPGYLYAFLQSRFGVPTVVSSAYGAIIQHIEPHQIARLPVARFGIEVEEEIHGLIQGAADLRSQFQAEVAAATHDLFESAGLSDLLDLRWHDQPRMRGFAISDISSASLRASNYDARARSILARIRSVPHRTLGAICENGRLSSGARFKRIQSDPGYGALLVGQKDGFWVRPEGRWINTDQAPRGILAEDETVMIASQGLPGENSLICRAMFITGSWLRFVYTQHFLRVVSGEPEFSGAYLFAFLRSEAAFRSLRSMLVGTGPQDIHPGLRAELPIPVCALADRERIAETVRRAYRWRDEADELEDRAQELLEAAVQDATGA